MRYRFAFIILASLASCSLAVDEERSHFRVDTMLWSDTTRTDDDGSARTKRTVDHNAIGIGYGGGYFDTIDRKLVGWEMTVGSEQLGQLDGWSLRASLRWYWPISDALRPYLTLGAGGLYLEDLEAAQGELHIGLGAEVPIDAGWFADLQLDYLYPGEPALDELTETIETEFEGWSLRLGLGWEF